MLAWCPPGCTVHMLGMLLSRHEDRNHHYWLLGCSYLALILQPAEYLWIPCISYEIITFQTTISQKEARSNVWQWHLIVSSWAGLSIPTRLPWSFLHLWKCKFGNCSQVHPGEMLVHTVKPGAWVLRCIFQTLACPWPWPCSAKDRPIFFTLAPLLTEGPSGKRKLVWTRNQNIHNHVNTWIHRKYLHPCEHVNTQTIITFRQDGKMSKMHRRRRSRDGLSHLSLFLLFQQFEGRVGVGEPAGTGHGAAAEPVWEGQLATMGWPGHPYRQTDAQVVSFTLKIFGR